MSNSKPARSETYKWIAYGLAIFGVVVLAVAFLIYRKQFAGDYSPSGSDWGQFGDYIGGVAGTLLAFATLIALVVALVVQATELEETRRALEDQVEASNNQLKLIKETERVRIQPVLKIEWFPHPANMNIVFLRFTNIGFGPCLMEQVHVHANSQHIGSHGLEDWNSADVVWRNALRNSLGSYFPEEKKVRLEPMNKYRKLLAAGETQQMLAVEFPDHNTAKKAIYNLQSLFVVDFEYK
ncbi:MAG: hypothetical protein RLN85_15190 [Pseudomonadales bacterium]